MRSFRSVLLCGLMFASLGSLQAVEYKYRLKTAKDSPVNAMITGTPYLYVNLDKPEKSTWYPFRLAFYDEKYGEKVFINIEQSKALYTPATFPFIGNYGLAQPSAKAFLFKKWQRVAFNISNAWDVNVGKKPLLIEFTSGGSVGYRFILEAEPVLALPTPSPSPQS